MSYEPPGGAPLPPPPSSGWQPPPAGAPYPASGYGYGQGYGSTSQPRSLAGLTTATSILLGITAVAALLAAFALFHRASLAADFTNASFQDLRDADSQVNGTTAFFSVARLATAVLWIIWQFRHAKNAQALRGSHGLAPGWAIGGWFIPLGNFVLPELQLYQSAKASDPDLPPGQPPTRGKVPGSLVAWWVLLIGGFVLSAIGSGVRSNRNDFDFDADRFAQGDRLVAIGMLVTIAAAIVAILLVRSLNERQSRAIASIPSAPTQQGYGQSWQQPPPQMPQTLQQPPPGQWPPPPQAPPPPQ